MIRYAELTREMFLLKIEKNHYLLLSRTPVVDNSQTQRGLYFRILPHGSDMEFLLENAS